MFEFHLFEFHLKEELAGKICPRCGGGFTSGIRDPLGDYDDWLVHPRCSQCGFEGGLLRSKKRPYECCEAGEKIRNLAQITSQAAAAILWPKSRANDAFWPARAGRVLEEWGYHLSSEGWER